MKSTILKKLHYYNIPATQTIIKLHFKTNI